MIVIQGKGQSAKAQPNFEAPSIYNTFAEIGERLEKIETGEETSFGVDAIRGQQESANPDRGPRAAATGTSGFTPQPGNGSAGTQAGVSPAQGNGGGTSGQTRPAVQAGENRPTPIRSGGQQPVGSETSMDANGGQPRTDGIHPAGTQEGGNLDGSSGGKEAVRESDIVPVADSSGSGSGREVVA